MRVAKAELVLRSCVLTCDMRGRHRLYGDCPARWIGCAAIYKEHDVEIVFNQTGTFQALYAAQQWCRDNGISFGSSSATRPTGLLRGDYCIAKWHNLTPKEISQLDGTMSGDFREGPVTIRLKD
jgi:hypothetical protein